jgi:gamma-glutamyl hydrolase
MRVTSMCLFLLIVSASRTGDDKPGKNFDLKAHLSQGLNSRPIIGVMTQPTANTSLAPYGSAFINADYVKFIELAGGRVVPVPFNASTTQLNKLFSFLNGLLYPGGGDILNGTLYYESAAHLFDLALQANQQGDYFPLWGTCLGFEFLSVVVSGSINLLTRFDAENISLPLSFTPYAPIARMFSLLNDVDRASVLEFLSSQSVTENYHHFGVSIVDFQSSPNLQKFYHLISTSTDRNGRVFVSSMEAIEYPVYAVQFHPERSLFEWDPTEAIDHSFQTVLIMQQFANFFVHETRKSLHRFPSSTDEFDSLIWNDQVIYSYKLIHDDMQMYVFP